MRYPLTLAVLVCALVAAPPASAGPAPFVEGTVRSAPGPGGDFGAEVVAELDRDFLRDAAVRGTLLLPSLPFPGGGRLNVALNEFYPVAPEFRPVEMTDAGPVEHAASHGLRFFRGTAPASEGSLAYFVLGPETFEGFVRAREGLAVYGVKEADDGTPLFAASLFSPQSPQPLCEADAPADQPWRPDPPPPWELPAIESSTPLTARIALEVDYDTYLHFGSVSAATTYATKLLGAVSTIYQADVNTSLTAANIRVWSTSGDPYSAGSDSSVLLGELLAEYTANMGSIQRASAHLLAKRAGMGGLAYLDVLCWNSYAYGVDGIHGTYTYPSSAYTWDAYCLAHELGHNFKSKHTHCYGTNVGLADWIDKCYASETSCYSGGVVNPPMGEKTVMSYCHLLSPYQVTMTFKDKYAYTSALIRQGAEAASCVGGGGCSVTCSAGGAPSSGTAPLTVNFSATATATNCTGSPTFAWTFGDGGTSNLQNPSHTYNSTGIYSWSMTATADGITCARNGTVTVTPPVCTLTCTASASPTSGTAPLQVNFTATATPSNCSGVVGITWTFGDGSVSTEQNPSHTYASAGTYSWTLLASVQGVNCSKSGTITVAAPCTLSCSASALPTSGTAPLNVKFTGSATPSGCSGSVTYAWAFGDGETSTSQSPTHTYLNPGTYGWTLTATIQGVPCTQSGTVTVTEPPCTLACTASASPASGLAPLDVSFTSTATPSHCSGGLTYAWTFGDGGSSAAQNPGHTYATAGTYGWTFTASIDGETCSRTGTVTVTAPPCTLTCEASASPASGAAPLGVSFSATATPANCSGPVTYAWTFGDGTTSTEQSPSHTYPADGTYAWSLTASVDGQTCTRTGTVTVTAACFVSCTANAAPSSGTAPLAVSFTGNATATNCSAGPTYAWAFGDGETTTGQNPSHLYAVAGTYTWTLTVTADGATCTRTGTITVNPGLPGDCDGDGSVSIGEVQKAINMFLGMQAVGCGVDCNGDGAVSIGEVQKVINAFLGIAVSC